MTDDLMSKERTITLSIHTFSEEILRETEQALFEIELEHFGRVERM